MGKRKTRSDKKRDIKPTVSREMKDCLFNISYITGLPVKVVLEDILIYGTHDRQVIDFLSNHFIRTVRLSSTVYIGNADNEAIPKRSRGIHERVSTRVSETAYEDLATLAYTFDCSVSRACTVLSGAVLKESDFLAGYIKEEVSGNRLSALKAVIDYCDSQNSGNTSLLDLILDGIRKVADLT